jgi:hypothetical protein
MRKKGAVPVLVPDSVLVDLKSSLATVEPETALNDRVIVVDTSVCACDVRKKGAPVLTLWPRCVYLRPA